MSESKAVKAILQRKNKSLKIAGVSGIQKSALTAALFALQKKSCVLVTAGRDELRELRRDLSVLLPEEQIRELYPNEEVVAELGAQNKSLEIMASRVSILRDIYLNKPCITLVTAEAFCQALPGPEVIAANELNFVRGQIWEMEEAIAALGKTGYSREDVTELPGHFSIRGGILDLFPLNSTFPVRIEWLDNEIDSIRSFSAETQRSLGELKSIAVSPIQTGETRMKDASLLDYLPDDSLFILDDAARIREKIEALLASGEIKQEDNFNWAKLEVKIKKRSEFLVLAALQTELLNFAEEFFVNVRSLAPYHRQLELLESDLHKWLAAGITPVICMAGEAKARGLAKSFSEKGFPALFWQENKLFVPGKVLFTACELTAGFELVGENWLLLSEQEIFGTVKRKTLRKKPQGHKIKYFSEIKSGDYVVHTVHGIGKYIGTKTINAGGVNRDYLLIRYAGEDKLYIPVEQVESLHKYIGADGHVPRLSKMGGSDWSRVRSRAKAAVTEMAVELLRLQAERKLIAGHAFSADTMWQKEFEQSFPYEETPDQLQALAEIKTDMQAPYPMDRILCGDVGYGKTEVAIRAAFKAVLDSKQVAVLVPTTVLAQQHFLTFSERMQSFGINVEMVSRFRTPKEQKETLKKTVEGKVDILIGTHRLLQNDVNFKNLGLLIIDEEQRFGVSQKEKIKRWSKSVDVLVLSATPIPRTLHMGLVNARDMSIIETPPQDRLPVATFVAEYDEELVRQALVKELNRGGYVYYVYNKVKDIEVIAEKITKLVPGIRVKVAHGQMPEELLENAMIDFYQGEFDVLVCTTIIENGLDVPLANTIIVHAAENFGLSQLYQMRGRVGRSSRLAYAWFLYPKKKALSEIAEKRLQAIRDFSDLGAGFRIAMRDLEIRGAGNILGPEQHGHIVSVGFETYCRLLEETMQELKAESPAEQNKPEPAIDIQVDAYIPDDYISDPANKLDVYRRLPHIDNQVEESDLLDELIDRFGNPPLQVLNLLKLSLLKGFCKKLGIRAITIKLADIKITFEESSCVRGEKLLELASSKNYQGTLLQGPPITMKLKLPKKKNALTYLEEILNFLLS